MTQLTLSRVLFLLLVVLCVKMSAPIALLSGILFSFLLGNPFLARTQKAAQYLLQASVVGLGAGMNLNVIGQVGLQGIGYTAIGITLTALTGIGLGKVLKTETETSVLLTVGTAICGGSAIAAVASTVKAKSQNISVAMATVFLLNAAALFIFPGLGHFFNLTETQFGLWSALAIHDTSSVVGASVQYGPHALEVATTVKLARALWIIPVSLAIGFFWNRRDPAQAAGKIKRPWFILGFLAAAALVTWVPALKPTGDLVSQIAKQGLVLTLFLIGSNVSRSTLRSVGYRPFLQGFCLWVLAASTTLAAILIGWVK